MAIATKTVPITKSALLQRVNRKLAHSFESVKVWRRSGHEGGQSWQPGDMYRVDHSRNAMLDYCVDLEALGRELEVLAPGEQLAE